MDPVHHDDPVTKPGAVACVLMKGMHAQVATCKHHQCQMSTPSSCNRVNPPQLSLGLEPENHLRKYQGSAQTCCMPDSASAQLRPFGNTRDEGDSKKPVQRVSFLGEKGEQVQRMHVCPPPCVLPLRVCA